MIAGIVMYMVFFVPIGQRTTWERAVLKVGVVQMVVDRLGGDDVGVDKTHEGWPSAS